MSDELSHTNRVAPLVMKSGEFRATGYQLADRIADFLDSMAARPANPVKSSNFYDSHRKKSGRSGQSYLRLSVKG